MEHEWMDTTRVAELRQTLGIEDSNSLHAVSNKRIKKHLAYSFVRLALLMGCSVIHKTILARFARQAHYRANEQKWGMA